MIKISVCIIAKNEAKNLPRCLNALKDFDEVVLLDNESTDDSVKIASEYENVKVFSSPFLGFGKLKQKAVGLAKNDWVFCLDADEVLDFDSKQKIKTLDLDDVSKVYMINRKNYYKNEWIKTCGFYPDYLARIFNKTHTNYNDASVHESVVIKEDSKTIKTDIHLHHFSFYKLSQFLQKLDKYTELYATSTTKKPSAFSCFSHGLFSFFKFYILKKGFLDGFKGFTISVYGGLNSFYKYAKAYEKNIKDFNLHLFGNDDNIKECLISLYENKVLPNKIFIYSDNLDLQKYSITNVKICGKKEFTKLNDYDIFIKAKKLSKNELKHLIH